MSDVEFGKELCSLINRFSRENGSNTPDFILASYLVHCLSAFDQTCNERTKWYVDPQAKADAALGRALRETFGDGVTVETVRAIREVVNTAQIAVTSPAFAGVSDEDVMLERAVEALARLRQEAK